MLYGIHRKGRQNFPYLKKESANSWTEHTHIHVQKWQSLILNELKIKMFLYILLLALIYCLLLFYLLFTFCLLMDGDIYQSTAYICLGKTLMGIRYQQCGTGETLLLKTETKLLQTLFKLTGYFNIVLWSSSVRTNLPHVMRFDGKGKGKKSGRETNITTISDENILFC